MTIVAHTHQELRDAISASKSVGFVPTMGALHAGHCSLLAEARKENELVVLSIYVNPSQFGPNEDFDSYPRTFAEDKQKAESEGVDIIFAPTTEVVYPTGFSTTVNVAGVSEELCGGSRPGHFQGVATVVARLFGMVQPHRAYFGLKDLQQCMVLSRMVRDLAMPIEMKLCPTIREVDGLAMSSRNQYLSAEEREGAPLIFRSLVAVQTAFTSGEKSVPELCKVGREALSHLDGFELEYFEIRSVPNLERLAEIPSLADSLVGAKSAVLIAGKLGNTRLIDNLLLN